MPCAVSSSDEPVRRDVVQRSPRQTIMERLKAPVFVKGKEVCIPQGSLSNVREEALCLL